MRGRCLIPLAVAASLGFAGAGHAQTVPETGVHNSEPELRLDRTVEAEEQKQGTRGSAEDPYAPLGIRAGGLTLYSSLEVLGSASSNVTQQHDDGEFGLGLTLRPSLRFDSDWVRHSWEGEASAELLRYLGHEEMATTSASAASSLRVDIRRTTRAEFSGSYERDADANRDLGVVGSEIGDETTHTINGAAGLTHEFGPLQTTLRAGLTRGIHDDVELSGGGTEDNSDRDYWEPSFTLRAAIDRETLIKPFAEASYTPRFHDRTLDRNGERRNSHGFALRAGVAIADDPVWSGEIAATYLRRDFVDIALSSNEAFGLEGALTWSPSELTRITLNLGTALTESRDPGDVGGQSYTANLNFSQSLRDNLAVLGSAGLTLEDSSSGGDLAYDGSLGLLWSLNRNVALTAAYDFTLLEASVASEDYTEHRVSAGVVLRH